MTWRRTREAAFFDGLGLFLIEFLRELQKAGQL